MKFQISKFFNKEPVRINFKRGRDRFNLAGLGVPMLTIIASLGGVYMGQRMIAQGESNKVIREKLELAYNLTLAVPDLALAVNMSATESVSGDNHLYKGQIYNEALSAYQRKIVEINTINALYSGEITDAVEVFTRCSKIFTNYAANHMLLERRDIGLKIASPLYSYLNPGEKLDRNESLNLTAQARVECELTGTFLNDSIAKAMKNHI